MKVAFDTSILLLLINPSAPPPTPPDGISNGAQARQRLNHLLDTLDQQNAIALLPAPSLVELLMRAPGGATQIAAIVDRLSRFVVAAFDERAAIECGIMLSQRYRLGTRRRSKEQPAKVKFDHQIVAIAKIQGATTIYSDDEDLAKLADLAGIACVGIWQTPLPPIDPQISMDLSMSGDGR
jgi:hypothetical protein